jgi:hypothetical protein
VRCSAVRCCGMSACCSSVAARNTSCQQRMQQRRSRWPRRRTAHAPAPRTRAAARQATARLSWPLPPPSRAYTSTARPHAHLCRLPVAALRPHQAPLHGRAGRLEARHAAHRLPEQ